MHLKYKIALFDVDGVLIIPPKLFSQQYCEKYGVNSAQQALFYDTKEFKDSTIGSFDLKEAIRIHNDKWQWQGDVDELLDMWFEGENYLNIPLLEVIDKLRAAGTKIYLATQQEKYRKAYLQKVVFKGKIDGIFCSCDIGLHKHEYFFWKAVLAQCKSIDSSIEPANIAYFDDRQNLVDIARKHGFSAFLYENADKVNNEVFNS